MNRYWILITLILAVGCSEKIEFPQTDKIADVIAAKTGKVELPPTAIRIVKVMTVTDSASENVRSFGGDVRARNETLLGFRIGGKISQRLVDVGAAVKPGQALARIDGSDLVLYVAEAEAQREMANADAKRYRDLRARNFVSQAAVDARDTAHKAASAQAALARNQTTYTVLTADHAGVVAEVLAQPGQVVAAGQGVFRLAWDGEREIAISIPEEAVSDIKVGGEAEISLWSTPGKVRQGRVRELAPVADLATRTYAARVSIVDSAADKNPPPLGSSATVRFKSQRGSLIQIPLTAIFQQGDKPAVWVIDKDSKLGLRPVRIASYLDAGALLEGGLAVGETIVTAGVTRLHAGEQVQIAQSNPVSASE